MKIIDKTPLQDANGQISFIARIQGTLKYGWSWYAELEAQKVAIAQLDRYLEKGFVLLRNFTLPNSEIVIPLVLLSTGGIYVIYVTHLKGSYQANGDQWNTTDNAGKPQPAGINLIDRISKLATVFQKYLKIQKVEMQMPVEPILMAIDPGMHIESQRPSARVIKSDAIKQFAGSLLQARPIWTPEFIHILADRIIDPAPPEEQKPVSAAPASSEPSRAKAASDQGQSFDANDLGFSFDEGGESFDGQSASNPPAMRESGAVRPAPRPTAKPAAGKKKILGLSNTQLIILAGMFVFWCCALIGFGAFIFLTQ